MPSNRKLSQVSTFTDPQVQREFENIYQYLERDLDVNGALTVGNDGAGFDVTFYSDTVGDYFFWDSSEEKLTITGTAGQTALHVADGNFVVTDTSTLNVLDATGLASLDGGIDVDGVFTVADTTGKVTIGGTTNADMLHVYVNNTTTASGVGLTLEQDGTGDTTLDWLLTGDQRFRAGITNANSNAWFLVPGSSYNAATAVTLNTAGTLSVGKLSATSSNHKFLTYQDDANVDSDCGIVIEQDGTGDASLTFLFTNTVRWIIGPDNSNSDTFCISEATSDGLFDTTFTITTGGAVGIGGTLNVVGAISQNSNAIWPSNWADYTPSYSASGSMTYTSVTTNIARWCQIGDVVYFQIRCTGTTGGTASTIITVTLPVTPSNTTTGNVGGGCRVADGTNVGAIWRYSSSGYIEISRYDSANWGLGASRVVTVQGHYEVA